MEPQYNRTGGDGSNLDVQRQLWSAVSDSARGQGQEAIEAGLTPLQTATLQLSAEAIHYAYTQAELDRSRLPGAPVLDDRSSLIREASLFNGRVRSFAESFPETSVNGLMATLRDTITQYASSSVLQNGSEDVIRRIDQVVNGARHEFGFGQLLPIAIGVLRDMGHGDFYCRPATPTEDYEYSADYVITMPDGSLMYIDVKSSAKSVGGKQPRLVPTEGDPPTEPYKLTIEHDRNGVAYRKITTWSYLDRDNDAHFADDRFYLQLPNENLQAQYHAIADMILQADLHFRPTADQE